MPFEPGKSGNPGGRPKMSPEERERWQALAAKCRARLELVAEEEDAPPAILVRIAELAADRGWGKPVQAIDIEPPEGSRVDFSFVSPPTSTGEV